MNLTPSAYFSPKQPSESREPEYLAQASLVCIEHSSCGLTCAPRLQEIFEHELPFKLIAATDENFIFAK